MPKINKNSKLIFLAAALLLSSCSLNKSSSLNLDKPAAQAVDENNAPDDGTPVPVDQITFKIVDGKVFAQSCVGCHSEKGGNRGDVNLETYEAVIVNKDAIKNAVANGSMPPRKKLSDDKIKLVLDWITEGAKKENDESVMADPPATEEPPVVVTTPVPAPEPVPAVGDGKVYFADVAAKVFETSCNKCHSTDAHKDNVILDSYAKTILSLKDIKERVADGTMPPKRLNSPLSDEQKKLVADWIAQGALEKAP